MISRSTKSRSIELPVRYFRFYPGDAPHGETFKTIQLDLSKTALLLVDVYHAAEKPQAEYLVNRQWENEWCRIVDSCLAPLIASARSIGLPIIYTSNSSPRIEIKESAFGHRLLESLGFDPTEDFRELEVNPLEFDAGDPVQLFIPPQIAPHPGDYFIRKHTYSSFFETRLDSLLRNLGMTNIIIAGFVEDVCLLFTMADAVFRGYNTFLVRDGTLATEFPEEVNHFLHTQRTTVWIESFLGPTTSSQEFINAALEKNG